MINKNKIAFWSLVVAILALISTWVMKAVFKERGGQTIKEVQVGDNSAITQVSGNSNIVINYSSKDIEEIKRTVKMLKEWDARAAGQKTDQTPAQHIYADKLIDPELSRVVYEFSTLSGEKMYIEMDYTADRPNPAMQYAKVFLDEPKETGTHVYTIPTEDKYALTFEFEFKDGDTLNVKVDTLCKPSRGGPNRQVFTIKSMAGYEIFAIFDWYDDGSVQNVELAPKINPFRDAPEPDVI